MLEQSNWHVERLGIENLLSIESRRLKDSLSGRVLRALPDLVAYTNEASGLRLLMIEVKTRVQAPSQDELQRYAQFEGVLIAWVSPTGIQGAWVIKNNGSVKIPVETDFRPIEEIPSLFLDTASMPAIHAAAKKLHL